MRCLYCRDEALFKCSCKAFYICSVHLGSHFSTTGSHPFENLDIELSNTKLECLRSNLMNRLQKINNAKTEMSLKTQNLIKTIKCAFKTAIRRFDEISNEYLEILNQKKFCKSDLQIVEEINLNDINIETIDLDEISNNVREFFFKSFVNNIDKLQILRTKFLEQHAAFSWCGAVTQDGTKLVTGGYDSVIRVWDLIQKKQIFTLQGHNSNVRCLTLTHDSQHIISGSSDASVRIWSFKTKKQVGLLKGHTNVIRGICYEEKNSLIISGDKSGELIIWDFNQHTIVKKINLSDEIGCLVLSKGHSKLIVGLSQNIVFYDIRTFKLIKTLNGNSGTVWCLCLTKNEKLMISGTNDGLIIIWDMKTSNTIIEVSGHSSVINSLALTSNDQFIVSGSDDETVRIWSIETGYQIAQFDEHKSEVLLILKYNENFITLSMNSSIGILDILDQELTINWFLKPFKSDFVNFVADLNLVGYGGNNEAAVWDLKTESDKNVLVGHNSTVQFVVISNNGLYAISGSMGICQNLIYWDLKNNTILACLDGHINTVCCGAFSENGLIAASGSNDKTVRTWDLKTKTQTFVFEGHTDYVISIKFLSSKNLLVSGGEDNKVIIWNLRNNSKDIILSGHNSYVLRILATEEEDFIVSCDEYEGIRVWNVNERRQVSMFSHEEQASAWMKKNKIQLGLVKRYLKV